MNELQIIQLTRLIADGLTAGQACKAVGVTQSALTRRLIEARKSAEGASEAEKAGQRFYPLLLSYEDAQRQRSKTLRKLRGHPEEKKAALEQHPLIYRDIRLLPSDVRQRIMNHIKNGSWLADAVEAEKVHASIALAWTERGFQAFLSGLEDEESTVYRDWYLDVLSALSQAKTSAAERIFSDSPLSFLLFGPGRERPDREGYIKSSRVTSTAEKPPIQIQTSWATATRPMQITKGSQSPYRVTYPEGYEPPRFDQTDDEDGIVDEG